MQVICINGAGDKTATDISTSYIVGSASALRERGMAELYKYAAKRRFNLTLAFADYRVGDKITMSLTGETIETLITSVEHVAFSARCVSRVVCEALA